jgi:hypothetical protein
MDDLDVVADYLYQQAHALASSQAHNPQSSGKRIWRGCSCLSSFVVHFLTSFTSMPRWIKPIQENADARSVAFVLSELSPKVSDLGHDMSCIKKPYRLEVI